jgi:hypothetical protein
MGHSRANLHDGPHGNQSSRRWVRDGVGKPQPSALRGRAKRARQQAPGVMSAARQADGGEHLSQENSAFVEVAARGQQRDAVRM